MPDPVYYSPSPVLAPPKPSTTGAYEDSIENAFSDYGNINQGYKNLLAGTQDNPLRGSVFNPTNYQQSSDVTAGLGNLSDLSRTGGYSPEDIANLRARGISPIRAVYANMQRELTRNKSLSGGYSPNFAAVSAKLAREESQQISDAAQKVNAGIAQSVASNRLSAAPAFTSAAGSEESKKLAADQSNEQGRLATEQANNTTQNAQTGNQLNILDAMKSLYGTTPALASTFGSQALQAAGINASNARVGGAPRPTNSGSVDRSFGQPPVNPSLLRYNTSGTGINAQGGGL